MCGLAGLWSGPRGATASASLRAMAATIAHRGPDAEGFWKDDEAGIALAHRRLSILDLSEAGAQPMASACGRYVIAFNGEIYNHLALREDLAAIEAAPEWRGHSDTETLLAAIARWGIEPALERLAGMFAFALWDRQTRSLALARDRMGEKPLYYGWVGDTLIFGSELKAICAFPGFTREIDQAALTSYLRFSCVPAPMTIYKGVRKLMPGHVAIFDKPAAPGHERHQAYWALREVAAAGQRDRWSISPEEASDRLEQLLGDVVESHMLSDVALGAFLSGGVDSSLITALMCARKGASKVRTFSIGFGSKRFNEAVHASAVASHLGTDHSEMIVTEDDALALVPGLHGMFDEPFADPSAIPTALLCQLTRREVTVALSGDGGDEVFGGYNRHVVAPRLWRRAERLPAPLRRSLGPTTAALQRLTIGRGADFFTGVAQRLGLPKTAADRLAKFGGAIGRADSYETFYREIVSTWPEPEIITQNAEGGLDRPPWPTLSDRGEQIMAMDALGYLPDDILVKVDRSAMAASLETRAPFLDVRVVEAAWHLPPSIKIAGGTGKKILRDMLYRHVPRALVDRPKQGFAVPLDDWLRGRLRDWAESLLSRDALNAAGLFDAGEVRRVWTRHTSGSDNAGLRLWAVLMAQAWAIQAKPHHDASRHQATFTP